MVFSKPVSTPMVDHPPLTGNSGSLLDDPAEYRLVIGSLQYLLFTRPDISYAVNKLSQYMHQPRTKHWLAAQRVLRYLSGTKNMGLFFSALSSLSVHAFSYVDWAGEKDNYSSTGAYLVYVGSHLVSWSSKKQRRVARSSTEAEYKSVSATASEVEWVVTLLLDYHVIRDFVQSGFLRVTHVSSKHQLADVLTKPLPRAKFLPLCIKIGLSSLGLS
ncbi:Retrovirus-related Pol polyprotein from transposon RE2 [Cardamine amara subsp. amara]|uniref:Retrovirus-related Pol polyprotein from transposon RE2 n=1 Tax=Cardamine amara subsp. amara TaxID=228776 RepID=A0ABD1C7D7_CARAN